MKAGVRAQEVHQTHALEQGRHFVLVVSHLVERDVSRTRVQHGEEHAQDKHDSTMLDSYHQERFRA